MLTWSALCAKPTCFLGTTSPLDYSSLVSKTQTPKTKPSVQQSGPFPKTLSQIPKALIEPWAPKTSTDPQTTIARLHQLGHVGAEDRRRHPETLLAVQWNASEYDNMATPCSYLRIYMHTSNSENNNHYNQNINNNYNTTQSPLPWQPMCGAEEQLHLWIRK